MDLNNNMSDRNKPNRQLPIEINGSQRHINSPAGTNQRSQTSHAEELANRLIAFSQLASEREVARSDARSTCPNGAGKSDDVPRLPVSIIKNTSHGQPGAAVSRPNNALIKRRAPSPPPPRRRRPSLSVDNIEEYFDSSSRSLKAEHDHHRSAKNLKQSDKSEFTASSTSLRKLKSLSSKDLDNSQSITGELDTSEAFSPSVRISQFNDEPESVLESAESLPSQCDKKGRCVYHPNIKLYKKGLLGGFSLIMAKCPLCENMSLAATDNHQNGESNHKLTINIKRSISAGGKRSNSAQRKRSNSVCSSGNGKEVVRRAVTKKNKCASSLTKKAMSENEAVCVEEGTAFLEESYRSINTNGSPVPRGKKLSINRARSESGTGSGVKAEDSSRSLTVSNPVDISRKSSGERRIGIKSGESSNMFNGIDGSPVSRGKKVLMNRALSDSDAKSPHKRKDNSRLSDMKTSSLKSSGSTVESSHDDTPDSQRTRTKLIVRSDTSDGDQGTTSILEKGLGKLSLLKNRSSSRNKSTSARSISSETLASKNSKARQQGKSFDSSGRCKCHPSIILAKKRPFGNGWDMIRDYCPMCAESESEVHTSKMNRLLASESKGERVIVEMNPSSVEITSSKLRSRSSSRLDASHRSENSARSRSQSGFRFDQSAFDKMSSQVARVQKMPYTTPTKEFGWYTGEVNEHGIPNGHGRMRTKTGNTLEGNWINGCLEEHIDRIKKMNSGFGTNVAPWKKSALSPHCDLNSSSRSMEVPSSRDGLRRKSVGVPAQHFVQSPPQYVHESQMQHHSQWQDSQHYHMQQPQSYIPPQPPGYFPTQQPLSYPAQQQLQSRHMSTQSSSEMPHINSFSTYDGTQSDHFNR